MRKKQRKPSRKRASSNRRSMVFKPQLIHAMNTLRHMTGSRRVEEVNSAPPSLIHDMSKALRHSQQHRIRLPKALKKQVKHHAKALRILSNPSTSIARKRHIIQQKGGGNLLGTIARLIPVVGPILGNLLDG